MRSLRVGAVNYLNTKPLVEGLDREPGVALAFDLPSRLATGLADGRYDVALIPSVEFFQDPSYSVVSNACIACRGPVLSVKLFFRRPPAEVKSLALDEGSRTSAALAKSLLAERFGPTVRVRHVGGPRRRRHPRSRNGAVGCPRPWFGLPTGDCRARGAGSRAHRAAVSVLPARQPAFLVGSGRTAWADSVLPSCP